ncbi:TonB-dependent receptor [Undibacterium pigrum]|uniref:TonB-dependent receptor-like protein n=1 Tax=Undibacterium pigrum TaxID=401470 RepID=A0A318J8Z1_9BURK|nr:TonB-dependent receptor plug domain-containing protein [Undibacterium pigrum]PXX43231.1 TonB-dependent receptor-like protein [Undibacterium pigrum]
MQKRNHVFKKKLVAHALTLAFGAGILSIAFSPAVHAQSNAAGTVYGKVNAGSATTVVLKNTETNLTRNVAIDANGKFQATALPIGHYRVSLMKDSLIVSTMELDVLAGQGVEAAFNEETNGIQSVTVAATRKRIDVSNASNGATFTAKELDKLPIAKNVNSIIQLAPNTTRSDPTYAGGAAFAGGGASENAYYINGMVVTNPLTQLGASELPFGAISQAQILVGGFGAEFGRSVGGIVNITTRGGTNNWEAGVSANITPNSLRSRRLDYYYPVIGASNTKATDGSLRLRREDNTFNEQQVGAYIGGPVIKDKLFMFIAAEGTRSDNGQVNKERTAVTLNENGWREQKNEINRYYGKLDWNINDDHRLELTAIGDKTKHDNSYYSYDYASRARGSVVKSSEHIELDPDANTGDNGADVLSLRYVGNITDNLTITAMYGQSKAKHVYQPVGYNASLFSITADANNRVPGLNYNSSQGYSGTLNFDGSTDSLKSMRLDLEYKLGKHLIRAGIDNNAADSVNAGVYSAGGGAWTYLRTTTPNTAIDVTGGVVPALAQYGGLAAQGYYVQKGLYSTVSNAYTEQSAQYIEDKYQISKDVLLTFGLRNEQFANLNQDKVKFVDMKNQLAPRFSAAWDVNGDSSFKVFGSAGRYAVQMPSVVALRQSNGSLNTNQYFTYTGTDSNGLPTGLVPITGALSGNSEYGQAKDPKTIAATNLKPMFQDELTLGFEKAYSQDLNFGAKVTYRSLRSTIDDFSDPRVFEDWAIRNHVPIGDTWNFSGAAFNPGEDNDFLIDFKSGKGYSQVHLTAAEIGMPKVKRVYKALDLFAEHPYRNGWYGKLNYTWARSEGNTEGQTLSDTVTGQADVATTQTWDYKELMYNANGKLPNDRTHQIKAFGYYDLSQELTIGGNLLIAAGRPRNCKGTLPSADPRAVAYGVNYNSAHFYCYGATPKDNVASPRGTAGNLEWDRRLDLNLTYKPQQVKGLVFKMDIFNVFNAQTVQKIEERWNNRNVLLNTYGQVLSLTAPRSVRLGAEYNYKF